MGRIGLQADGDSPLAVFGGVGDQLADDETERDCDRGWQIDFDALDENLFRTLV
jgi:hypothetical protein